MTRARDMANLGSQAGSGLDASDITTGVLPVGVTGGSGLTALGTVATGTIGAAVTKKIHGFSAYLSTSANVTSSASTFYEFSNMGTWTERWDSHGHLASGRFTPTVQGVYLFGYSIGTNLLDANQRTKAEIRKNGSTSAGDVGGRFYDWSFSASDYTVHHTGSTLMQLDTDDYASFWFLQESTESNAQPFINLTEWWGCLIGTV